MSLASPIDSFINQLSWTSSSMPRSAVDATRFTSTTPHVSSKPAAKFNANAGARPGQPAKALPHRTQGPSGETAMEKVARLRAAAASARDAEFTAADRLVLTGRVWADRLHRFTARGLILITFVVGGVTVYALGDMMIYNRRKRREYFAEQLASQEAQLHDARAAFSLGTASEAQLFVLEKEDGKTRKIHEEARDEADVPKKAGITKRTWAWLTSNLKSEEEGEDVGSSERRLGYESINEEDDMMGASESDIVRSIEEKKSAIQEKGRKRFAKEKDLQRSGGPLDRIGTEPEPGMPKKGGWTSYMPKR